MQLDFQSLQIEPVEITNRDGLVVSIPLITLEVAIEELFPQVSSIPDGRMRMEQFLDKFVLWFFTEHDFVIDQTAAFIIYWRVREEFETLKKKLSREPVSPTGTPA